MDKEEEVPRPSEGQTSSANTDVERGLKDGKKESNVITALVAGVNELIKQVNILVGFEVTFKRTNRSPLEFFRRGWFYVDLT